MQSFIIFFLKKKHGGYADKYSGSDNNSGIESRRTLMIQHVNAKKSPARQILVD